MIRLRLGLPSSVGHQLVLGSGTNRLFGEANRPDAARRLCLVMHATLALRLK